MNLEEALKHADDNGKFWKIHPNTTVKGYFIGDIMPKILTAPDGKKNISYSIDFVKDGERKELSVSAALLRELNTISQMNGINFLDAIFTIKRTGAGLGTKWSVVCEKKNQNPVTNLKEVFGGQQIEEKIDGVPF